MLGGLENQSHYPGGGGGGRDRPDPVPGAVAEWWLLRHVMFDTDLWLAMIIIFIKMYNHQNN